MPSSSHKSDYSELILEIVNDEKRPIPIGIILRKILLKIENIDQKKFFENISNLLNSAQLIKLKNNKIVLGYPKAEIDRSKFFIGTIFLNSKLAGFITEKFKNESEYFVHHTNLNGALNGDTVEFALLKIEKSDQRLKDAIVTKIIKRKKNFFVGCFHKKQDDYLIECDDQKMYFPIKLTNTCNLMDQTKYLFEITSFEKNYCLAKVKKNIGHVLEPGTDVLSILYDNGIKIDFSPELLNECEKISSDCECARQQCRKDLTNLNIITIDPKTSKDFDDAFYVKKINNNLFKLYVCIADVSNYAKWKSNLDKIAKQRGNSIYLIDRVIPMLPFKLSDDICSLNPSVKRLTLTCEIDIDKLGEFKKINVYPSIIKSHQRYNYEEINSFFDDSDLITDEKMKKLLDEAYELHKILDFKKQKRGYINFNISETKIIVNEKCEPIEIQLKQLGDAQKMVEDFMLAANEAVTIFAHMHKLPFIYRIHDLPEQKKINTFNIELQKLGIEKIDLNENIKPSKIAGWLKKNENNENIDLINILLLRLMAKAKYSTKNTGHFGLALKNYTHFTSPIRRYADLVVHRIFWMFLFTKNEYSDSQRNELKDELQKICEKVNECETIAVQTERDVNNFKLAQYMTKFIGCKFSAKVLSVSPYGLFLKLSNSIEGFIKINNLKDDFYIYDQNNYQLVGKNKKQIFTLGTKIYVKCIVANPIQRKIEFDFIQRL